MSDLANELFDAGAAMNRMMAAGITECPECGRVPPRRVPMAMAVNNEGVVYCLDNGGLMWAIGTRMDNPAWQLLPDLPQGDA